MIVAARIGAARERETEVELREDPAKTAICGVVLPPSKNRLAELRRQRMRTVYA